MSYNVLIGNVLAMRLAEEIKTGTVYGSLHFGPVDLNNPGASEISSNGYTRPLFTGTVNVRLLSNSAPMVWPALPTTTIVAVGLWSALTNGDFLLAAPLAVPVSVESGVQYRLEAGDLAVAF